MKKRILFTIYIIVLFLSGCTQPQVKQETFEIKDSKELLKEGLANKNSDNKIIIAAKESIKLLQKQKYKEATKILHSALKFDVKNPSLHFLNALSYHLQSLNGNQKMIDLAQAGYQIALRLDPTNYWASYLLGHIYIKKGLYKSAQNEFAHGLLYAPKNTQLLKAMSVASYYARDTSLAIWAAKQAFNINPNDISTIRNLMISQASLGQIKKAKNTLTLYKTLLQKSSRNSFVKNLAYKSASKRLEDWEKTYIASSSIFGNERDFQKDFIHSNETENDMVVNQSDIKKGEQENIKVSQKKDQKSINLPHMTLVDVVILRTQQVKTENKGINLLDGIAGTLGGIGVEYDNTQNKKLTFNPQFTLSGLEYNLNIFNDGKSKTDIIARPSLLAIDGQESQFYSGEILHVQLSSNNSDGSMVDIPIGLNLVITPHFLSDDIVQIKVHAHRSFLETTSEKVGFTSFSQTSKTSVDSTAVLKLGDTLILSGLSENENNYNKSGIPFLQDLPGVQYVSSNEKKLEVKNSLLILLTPREARFTNSQQKENIKEQNKQESNFTKDLRHKAKIKVNNLDIVLAHLSKNNPFYNEFQKGDMNLESWQNDSTLLGSFIRALGFLYY